ncbi:MAG: hypothetical protein A2Z75_08605 [Chloroflexi bacterium RBG_13_50_10]|nr:MAG: hypothetical protein A2Z75_08605 [Chloroflexi bacterium RBG_13_50_10]
MLSVQQTKLQRDYFGTTKTLLRVQEVSQLLHVHENTVRRWSNQGIIKAYRIGPRRDRRYKQDDIRTFLTIENRERL